MIISIKSSSAGSSRGLVHYLAHSKLDKEKEGIERREFFNEQDEALNVGDANRHLSRAKLKPAPEELLHVIIAPSQEEIERLGEDQKTRKTALREIVRETVAALKKEIKAKNLKWVAALHFNTDNPHAHLAVQKQFLNEAGKHENLRINRQLLHFNKITASGEKKLQKGTLIRAAENKIEAIAETRERTRKNEKSSEPEKAIAKSENQAGTFKRFSSDAPVKIPNYHQRRTLAAEMLVAAEIARRERNIENLIEHGDKKRFKIKDEATASVRHVSLFDIERKIEIVSRRRAQLSHPKTEEKRAELIAQIAEVERSKHESAIRQLEKIRLHVLGFENRHLNDAQQKHGRLRNQKLLIEKECERLNREVPLPLFNADEIQQLQTEAIKERNSEKTLNFERIRQSNAAELNRPSRRDQDVSEFLAIQIVSRLKTQAAEKKLLEFLANKEFVKVRIGNKSWSHRELDLHELKTTRKKSLWTEMKTAASKVLPRSNEKNSRIEKLDYPTLRGEIENALKDLETSRRAEIARQKEFDQTLEKIFDSETNPKKTRLEPAFASAELAETEDLALELGKENFYEKSLPMQEKWLRETLAEKIKQIGESGDAQSNENLPTNHRVAETEHPVQIHIVNKSPTEKEKIIGGYVLGRAAARLVLAEMRVSTTAENLAKYRRDKLFIKHRILDEQTGAEREISLHETEPKKRYYLLDSMLERALETKEQKHLRKIVREIADRRETELLEVFKNAGNHAARLEIQKQAMHERFSTGLDAPPIFTPKEIAALDVRAAKTNDETERTRLEKLIGEAEKNNCVIGLHDLLRKTANDLEKLIPNFAKEKAVEALLPNNPNERHQSAGAKREIKHQNTTIETNILSNEPHLNAETIQMEKTATKERGRGR